MFPLESPYRSEYTEYCPRPLAGQSWTHSGLTGARLVLGERPRLEVSRRLRRAISVQSVSFGPHSPRVTSRWKSASTRPLGVVSEVGPAPVRVVSEVDPVRTARAEPAPRKVNPGAAACRCISDTRILRARRRPLTLAGYLAWRSSAAAELSAACRRVGAARLCEMARDSARDAATTGAAVAARRHGALRQIFAPNASLHSAAAPAYPTAI